MLKALRDYFRDRDPDNLALLSSLLLYLPAFAAFLFWLARITPGSSHIIFLINAGNIAMASRFATSWNAKYRLMLAMAAMLALGEFGYTMLAAHPALVLLWTMLYVPCCFTVVKSRFAASNAVVWAAVSLTYSSGFQNAVTMVIEAGLAFAIAAVAVPLIGEAMYRPRVRRVMAIYCERMAEGFRQLAEGGSPDLKRILKVAAKASGAVLTETPFLPSTERFAKRAESLLGELHYCGRAFPALQAAPPRRTCAVLADASLAIAVKLEAGEPLAVSVTPVEAEGGFILRALLATFNRLDQRQL